MKKLEPNELIIMHADDVFGESTSAPSESRSYLRVNSVDHNARAISYELVCEGDPGFEEAERARAAEPDYLKPERGKIKIVRFEE